MSTQAIAYGSVFLVVAAITLLGCWLQWRWWIIGQVNRWKAAKCPLKDQKLRERPTRIQRLLNNNHLMK